MNQIDPHAAFANSSINQRAAAASGLAVVNGYDLRPEAKAAADGLAARPISARLLMGLVQLGEFVALTLLGLVVYRLYVAPEAGVELGYGLPLAAGSISAVFLLQAAGVQTVASLQGHLAGLERVFIAWTLVFAAFALILFFTKSGSEFSRVWFGSWYGGGLLFFTAERAWLARLVRRWAKSGRLERRAVIVGGGQAAADLIGALEAQPGNDIRICGIFDDRGNDRSPAQVAGYPKLGTVAELVNFCRLAQIDMLIVSLPVTAETRLLSVLKQLWVLPVDIRLSAHSAKLRFRPRAYSYVGRVPFLDVFDRPIADWDSIAKRCFDVAMAAVLLVMVSPILLATAIAIKLDTPGPIFFRQRRFGFNNEVIQVLKFRSLRHEFADPTGRKVVTKGDNRVTRVGRFIRRTSIDELPQLVNVLRGNLSLVGPRPHPVQAATDNTPWERLVDGYFARHRVKPGVTGWAQISGWRGEVDTAEKIRKRVECDLHYIENWSVLFDLYIVAMTPFRLIHGENAY